MSSKLKYRQLTSYKLTHNTVETTLYCMYAVFISHSLNDLYFSTGQLST